MRDKSIISLSKRLYSRIEIVGDCWLWTGFVNNMGYGQIRCDGAKVYTHRASYLLAHGSIPPGMFVCHRCDTPRCINPDHLFLGTPADNVRDAQSKGRIASGSRSGNHTHPEKRERGDKHWVRRMPDRVARGAAMPGSVLTDEKVRAIRQQYAEGRTTRAIAREIGITQSTVWRIIHRLTWKHVA